MPRLAAISAENPAKLYGIHPKKEILQVGADADMVFVDLDKEVTITNARARQGLDDAEYHKG